MEPLDPPWGAPADAVRVDVRGASVRGAEHGRQHRRRTDQLGIVGAEPERGLLWVRPGRGAGVGHEQRAECGQHGRHAVRGRRDRQRARTRRRDSQVDGRQLDRFYDHEQYDAEDVDHDDEHVAGSYDVGRKLFGAVRPVWRDRGDGADVLRERGDL